MSGHRPDIALPSKDFSFFDNRAKPRYIGVSGRARLFSEKESVMELMRVSKQIVVRAGPDVLVSGRRWLTPSAVARQGTLLRTSFCHFEV